MRRDKYGFIVELTAIPEPAAAAAPADAFNLGCSCSGCFLIVNGFALMGKCGSCTVDVTGMFSSIASALLFASSAAAALEATFCLLITLTMVGIELDDFDF